MPQIDAEYTSIHERSIETSIIVTGPIRKPGIKPLLCERLREWSGNATCTERNTRSKIESKYPNVQAEDGTPESDPMFTSKKETRKQVDWRHASMLSDICKTSDSFIAITSHELSMKSMFSCIRHPACDVKNAAVIPVLLEITGIPFTSIPEKIPHTLTWKHPREWIVTFNRDHESLREDPFLTPEDWPYAMQWDDYNPGEGDGTSGQIMSMEDHTTSLISV